MTKDIYEAAKLSLEVNMNEYEMRETGSETGCTCQEGLCVCCGGCDCNKNKETAAANDETMPREQGTDVS